MQALSDQQLPSTLVRPVRLAESLAGAHKTQYPGTRFSVRCCLPLSAAAAVAASTAVAAILHLTTPCIGPA
jgi:hypothetical protein